MNICCPCGDVLHPDMPHGRWAMDPTLFLRQNPFPLPLHHAILVSREGAVRIECPRCQLGHEILWHIVYNSEADRQGSRVRYVMTEGPKYKVCSWCGMRWPEGEEGVFHPPVVDAHHPCGGCVGVLVKDGVGTHCFKDQS